MKIIQSITKAQEKYEPSYAQEDMEETEEVQIPIKPGTTIRNKNGKKTVRAKRTIVKYYADDDFENWSRENKEWKEKSEETPEDVPVADERWIRTWSRRTKTKVQMMTGKGCECGCEETEHPREEEFPRLSDRAPPEISDIDPKGSVEGWCLSADDGSRAEVQDEDARKASPKPKPPESYRGVSLGGLVLKEPEKPIIIKLSHIIPEPEEEERGLSLLTRATTLGAMTISSTAQSEWEAIEITVDSGACDTVLPSSMLASIQTESTEASRNGEEYEVANGHSIVNEGQKRCIMMTPGSNVPKGIVFQVSDVHKPLMSVGAMSDAGCEVLMSKKGGFMRDSDTGEMIPLIRRGNMYVLRAWVKGVDANFARPS